MKLLLLPIFLLLIISCNDETVPYDYMRKKMVEEQIIKRGIKDKKVLDAMLKIPRHEFVPIQYRNNAYADSPLPIGEGQTISQPYIVAFMTEILELKGKEKVLEIGTGSGYQAAVLAEIVNDVYTIEIIESLGKNAEKTLNKLGYKNIKIKIGDGYKGWPEYAPFDAIIVTAAPKKIPPPLIEQLADGGRMIIPVGDFFQELILVEKQNNKISQKSVLPVRFVSMTGEAEKQ